MHTSNLSLHFLDTACHFGPQPPPPPKKEHRRHRVAMMQFFLHYSDDGMKFKLPKWKLDSLHIENSILSSIAALRPKLTVKIHKSITCLEIAQLSKGSIDLQQNTTYSRLFLYAFKKTQPWKKLKNWSEKKTQPNFAPKLNLVQVFLY